MNSKHTKTEKAQLVGRYLSGEAIALIITENNIPRSTFYSWVKHHRDNQLAGKTKEISLKKFRLLENKVGRLEGIIKILQTASCTAAAPLSEKLVALEELYGQYNVHMLCEAFGVARGTFYNHIFRNKKDATTYAKRREELRIKIREVYNDSRQIFGAGKIAAIMKNDGYRVSAEMVLELMREMGLASIRQDAKSMYLENSRKMKNHLNQNFHTNEPNHVWASDVTYFRYNEKSYYICVIMDLFSRKIIGYKIGFSNSTNLVKSTFKRAYETRKSQNDLIFHSDCGAPYRSKTFCEYLRSLNTEKSFSRPYVPYDNSVVETFFSSMKREELYRTKYRSEKEFRKAVDDYMIFYNSKRPHAKLKYKTPEQMESDFADSQRESQV